MAVTSKFTPKLTPEEAREEIRGIAREILRKKCEIEVIAREHIPDYHFLDFSVSTFFKCSKSPIGLCVFIVDKNGKETVCRYCGDPNERK